MLRTVLDLYDVSADVSVLEMMLMVVTIRSKDRLLVVVMPAWLAVWFDALIPDRIADAIINMVAKKSGINADTAGVSHMTTNL